jgi:2-dehydropantoate 2-reductase
MGKRIAVVGVGAVGGYTAAHMARAGEDVTFIDMWPAHVEEMKTNGLRITHHEGVDPFTVEVRALHLTEAQHLSKEAPIDIAFVCTKSYDTQWAAMLIKQYLAPSGYIVSLQNCMNEETIAGVVGWGKTMGCIASNISVGLVEPGQIHRGGLRGGAAHTVYRTGEVHGGITERAHEVCRLVSLADSAKVTDNLWGERWSKLVANSMANGVSACTGLSGVQITQSEPIRHFQARLGSEAIRVGQALGYNLEEINHMPPETIARAGEGEVEALAQYDANRLGARRGSAEQRPSMGQDMMKGRRTEIEFLNGFVVREGEKVGINARANALLVGIVKKVERGELKQDPRHITDLRLN